jgi:hypothetical protein
MTYDLKVLVVVSALASLSFIANLVTSASIGS